jgi:hypothetical protein
MINYFKQHRKIREAAFFAVFSIFIWLAFVLWARFDAARQENKHNRELALRQCGAMIQDGKIDDLSLIVNNLLESEIFKPGGWGGVTWQACDMSKSFREAMLIESAKMKKNTGVILLTGFLIWCAFLAVWMALHLFHAPANWYFRCLMIFSVICLFGAFASSSAAMGYSANGIRFDLETLQRALALPEFPPTMLEQLQNPEIRGPYRYLPYRFEMEK